MEGPLVERGGGGNAASVWYLLPGEQALHAQAETCAGQMSAVSTGPRMAMLASGQQVEVDTVAPNMARVTAAHKGVRRQYPRHGLSSAEVDASFAEAVVEQSSQGSASRRSAPGRGGLAHPLTSGPVPSNHHGCSLYIFQDEYMYKYTAPSTGMGSLNDMSGTLPSLCKISSALSVF